MAWISYIEDLCHEDIALLTQLLADTLPDFERTQWLRDQSTALKAFPPRLLRPTNLLPRLTVALQLPCTPGKAVLCPSHKQLNPQLIRRLFLQISAESTVRLARLVSSPELEIHPVPPTVAQFIQRMQNINSLWMDPETFSAIFLRQPKFRRVESGCEACILAHVGGNRQFLTDLRTAMLGRRRKHAKNWPVLWPVVEGWVSWTLEGEEIHAESERIGKEVRKFHRILQLTQRGTPLPEKYQPKAVQKQVDAEEKIEISKEEVETAVRGADESGTGNDDLSVYSQPTPRPCDSTNAFQNLALQSNLSTIHPAFRESLVFCPATGTFEPRRCSHPVLRPAAPTPLSRSHRTCKRGNTRLLPSQSPPLPEASTSTLALESSEQKRLWNVGSNSIVSPAFYSAEVSSALNVARPSDERAKAYRQLIGRRCNQGPLDGRISTRVCRFVSGLVDK